MVDVHITYAHLFYAPRTVAPDDSAGRTLTLSGVPSNAQDAGTYGGSANQLGINIAGHFGAMHQRARRTRAEKEARRSPVPPGQRRSSTPASPPSVSR